MTRQESELMLEHVRSIYQAVTGAELKEPPARAPLPPGVDAVEHVISRFAELEALRRLVGGPLARVPQFGFVPPADVVDTKAELIVELAAPGVTAESVQARVENHVLVVAGVRNDHTGGTERPYRWTEIPRGPFHRLIAVGPEVAAEPVRIEAQHGIVRVHLRKVGAGAVAKA